MNFNTKDNAEKEDNLSCNIVHSQDIITGDWVLFEGDVSDKIKEALTRMYEEFHWSEAKKNSLFTSGEIRIKTGRIFNEVFGERLLK